MRTAAVHLGDLWGRWAGHRGTARWDGTHRPRPSEHRAGPDVFPAGPEVHVLRLTRRFRGRSEPGGDHPLLDGDGVRAVPMSVRQVDDVGPPSAVPALPLENQARPRPLAVLVVGRGDPV